LPHRLSPHRLSLFPKLILMFLVVIAPLFGLSLALNELGRQEVQSQLSDALAERMQYELQSLENELRRVAEAQQQLVNDSDLLTLSSQSPILSDYQRSQAINRLGDKLLVLQESSPYIQQASLYIVADDRLIATGGLHDRERLGSDLMMAAREVYRSGYAVTVWADRLFLLLSSPMRPSEAEFLAKPPRYVLSMELSRSAIGDMLARIAEDGMTVLAGDGEQWTVQSGELIAGLQEQAAEWEPAGASMSSKLVLAGSDYLAFRAHSLSLDATLTTYLPEDSMLGSLKSYRTWFWMLVGCSIVIVVLFAYGIYLTVQRPLLTLVRQFRNVEQGQLHRIALPERRDELGMLFEKFDTMVGRLKQTIDELYVQKIRSQRSELRQLQAQIAPHFLYNSFFVLQRLITSYENEQAERLSRHLGQYFQYITRNERETAPLLEEVSHVYAYAEIQSIRYGERIRCELTPLPERWAAVPVPRLILQPVVENAFEHAFEQVLQDGELTVRFVELPERLDIVVEDNGSGMSEEELEALEHRMRSEEDELSGLVNVHRRLLIQYGEGYGLSLQARPQGGLAVTVSIPWTPSE